MKTTWTKKEEVKREWYLVDVKDEILGRAATKIASLLIGKSKVTTVPNVDNGDHVVVINAGKIKLTRGKEKKKMYYRHSGYPGGFRETRFDELIKSKPIRPIQLAVKRMLPDNKLRAGMMARLYIFEDEKHTHEAQKPTPVKLSTETK